LGIAPPPSEALTVISPVVGLTVMLATATPALMHDFTTRLTSESL
jgi:hypothetical protein